MARVAGARVVAEFAPESERELQLQLRLGLRVRSARQALTTARSTARREPISSRSACRATSTPSTAAGTSWCRKAPPSSTCNSKGYASLERTSNAIHALAELGSRVLRPRQLRRLRATDSRAASRRVPSGMPVFGESRPRSARTASTPSFVTLNHQSEMDQKFVEANLQGQLGRHARGEARFSAGVHSRTNSYYYIFDPLQTQKSFNDNPMGFPANNTEGRDLGQRDLRRGAAAAADGQAGRRALEPRARLSLLRLRAAGRRRHVQGADRLGHHRHAALPRRPPARNARAEHRRDVPSRYADLGPSRWPGDPCGTQQSKRPTAPTRR